MKRKSVLFIIGILIILFLFSTNIYRKTNSNVNDNHKFSKEEIKKELLNKIKIMSADDLLTNLYRDNFYINKDSYPLIIEGLLLGLNTDGNISDIESDNLYEKTNICTNNSYISLANVEKEMKNIYGQTFDIDYQSIMEDINYIYDTDTKRFYELCTSRHVGSDFIDTYVYNFEIEQDNAYIYLAVSYGNEEPVVENGETTDKTKVTIYTDYKKDNLYKSYIYDGNSNSDMFLLDESNYKDFSLYKYVFKKNHDNYYFDSLERIKNFH